MTENQIRATAPNMKQIDKAATDYIVDYFRRGFIAHGGKCVVEAFKNGAIWMMNNQWRDPKVELPEDGQTILIYTSYIGAKSNKRKTLIEQYVYFKQYEKDGFELKESSERNLQLQVLAWMPIPEYEPNKQ